MGSKASTRVLVVLVVTFVAGWSARRSRASAPRGGAGRPEHATAFAGVPTPAPDLVIQSWDVNGPRGGNYDESAPDIGAWEWPE
jgi:hypothetical protein